MGRALLFWAVLGLGSFGWGLGIWVEIPAQFQLAHRWHRQWMEYYEYLPKGEPKEEAIAILVGNNRRNDPARFLKLWEENLRRSCPAGRLEILGESPHRWIEWKWVCPGREVVYGKGLRGEKGFYLVRWQLFKKVVTPVEEGRILRFLKRVHLIEEGR